ncbi:diguanylate cyclase (GGDEF)-like protein [Halanaerobium saccharolyticum]|uniref:Diguanylate cyclase (GGDEF)-like protein n=1 Tax=Halanaerobium saccharolyticum TaxID=43595 RepID=A0A4V3G5Z8_9FIRM|nr:GGDEF domain-containing protein [Halanaerobium saccharolyticum]RAK11708.1 diguanylate cyclase (GGDEF)-like protein [Halanaerobium saccharolyticum]TDW07549.1 diguanylate cyclase (GGDEF)-like protein [Halanaerobium saccharolyticum]TDX64470.1 diguanylate cyclase (GGDEF)-like protein [Halanaerobium saccharolyticum]
MEKMFNKFKYIIIILLALIMIYIFSGQYSNVKEVVEDKYNSRQQLVEKNILQTVNYINNAYKIVEQQLNQEMRDYSEQMVEKYREEPDVMNWNLAELQQQFPGYDIYIIDQSLKIIKTTYQEDLGLDFSRFSSFASVLRNRMNGNEFEVDRIDLSTQAGEIKKYSYMPSPDHQYLFELSVSIEDQYPSFQSLNLFKDATALTSEYEMVEDISFYSVEPLNYDVAKIRNSKKPYINPDVPEFEEELARQTVINNSRQEDTAKIEGTQYRYRFFPALVSDAENEQGWNSYVVGIVYNEQIMRDEISSHRRLFAVNIVLLAALFASFIAVVVYLLRKFEHQAYHDKLTGLANRKYFVEEFKKLKEAADSSGNNIGVVFIDIDKFKEINDNYGHDIGDRVLENIASRMENNLKETDITARMGGDEFVVALADLNSKTKIIKVVKRLIKELKKPLIIDGEEIVIGVSAGLSFYPDDSKELEKLIKNADAAMYKAKRKDTDIESN